MRSPASRHLYFQADASALGGSIEQPFSKLIPSPVAASLPPAGGLSVATSGKFDFEGIVSFTAAHTRVSGREHRVDGPWSTLITATVEGLNILEVITAERVVAQLSIQYPQQGPPCLSLAGSHFQDLRIGGFPAFPRLNPRLLRLDSPREVLDPCLHFDILKETGREQTGRLLGSIPQGSDADWLFERYGWTDPSSERSSDPARGTSPERGQSMERDGIALCSLVDGVDAAIPGTSFGHVIEIADFGRIFLGELIATRRSFQLSMIRAELGCNTKGTLTVPSGGGQGTLVPP